MDFIIGLVWFYVKHGWIFIVFFLTQLQFVFCFFFTTVYEMDRQFSPRKIRIFNLLNNYFENIFSSIIKQFHLNTIEIYSNDFEATTKKSFKSRCSLTWKPIQRKTTKKNQCLVFLFFSFLQLTFFFILLLKQISRKPNQIFNLINLWFYNINNNCNSP